MRRLSVGYGVIPAAGAGDVARTLMGRLSTGSPTFRKGPLYLTPPAVP